MKREFETVQLEREGHVATITLNRPERLNAINQPMPLEMEEAVVLHRERFQLEHAVGAGA